MLLTEFHPTNDTPEAGPHGRLGLRVRCESEDQVVDLPCGKTTIGSSPRCNLRIQRAGVHPLQCLVVCNEGGLTARRWAADTRINGKSFDDARLEIGDHLSIGPVDLEVVEVEEPRDEFVPEPRSEYSPPAERLGTSYEPQASCHLEPAAEPASLSWGKDTIHHTTVWVGEEDEVEPTAPTEYVEPELESPDEREEPEAELPTDVVPAAAAREVYRQLQAANATSRSRCRKLLGALRTSREKHTSLQAQADGLANTKDETVAECEALLRERNTLREQLATAERRYAEWEHQSNLWEDQRKNWDAARAEWERTRIEFDRQQFEWTQQIGEWESRLAGHVSRIEQLEAQLADTRVQDEQPAQTNTAPVRADGSPKRPASAEPSDPSWSGWGGASFGWSDSESKSITTETTPPIGFDWTNNADATPARPTATTETAEAQVPAWERINPAEPPTWERHTPAWETESPSWEDHGPANDDEAPAWDHAAPQPLEEEEYELPIKPETDIAPPARPVISPAPTRLAEPATPRVSEQQTGSPAAVERSRPVSYIERFSHMFAEEEAAGTTPPPVPTRSSASDQNDGKPRNMTVVPREGSPTQQAPAAENEESIEDYMAKLLQRVRGDRPAAAVSQSPPAATTPQTGPSPQHSQSVRVAANTGSSPAAGPAANILATEPRKSFDEQVPDLSELVRKAPVIEHPTNLVALRALANESARRAIGVHASKKHRRDAVTKFIVASLAGMTSVWLMMRAPDWRDMQFIAACVTLLIALYWAGQAYARLCEMHRASEYDPDFDDADDLNPRLPSDR